MDHMVTAFDEEYINNDHLKILIR